MKKAMKLVTTLLVVIMLTLSIAPVALATDTESGVDTILDQMKETKDTDTSEIASIGGTFVNILTTVGVVVAVIVLIILGIKYMMGSASEKAEYKKTMIPYLVGAILIMSASFIVKALFSIFAFGG